MPSVFLSWSGDGSKRVAEVLHEWLPVALQSIKPFLSSEDLRKGGRWLSDLHGELAKESFGVLCLTQSNLTSPWILYEAGALSKSLSESRVAPLLIGVKPSDLPDPLKQFNAVTSDRNDFKRLLKSINELSGESAVASEVVEKASEACWLQVEAAITAVTELPVAPKDSSEADPPAGTGLFDHFDPILQELLLLNRQQTQILSVREREEGQVKVLQEAVSDLQRSAAFERAYNDQLRQSVNEARELLLVSDLSTVELRRAVSVLGRAIEERPSLRRRRRVAETVPVPTPPALTLSMSFKIDPDNAAELDELVSSANAASNSDVSWERSASAIRLIFDPVPPEKDSESFRVLAEDLGFKFLDEEVRGNSSRGQEPLF